MNVKRQLIVVTETLRMTIKREAESGDVTIIFKYKAAPTPSLNYLIILIYNALYVRLFND